VASFFGDGVESERIVVIAQHLAKLWGETGCLKHPVRSNTVLLKDELASNLTYGGQPLL